MKVLLTGASGFIGRHLALHLGVAGHVVVPVSRRHGIDLRRLTTPAVWRPWLAGVDAVINAAGLIGETPGQSFADLHVRAPVALFQACADAGVRRVVQVSALGADAAAVSAYHRSKLAADEALRRLPLDWVILRPSLVDGAGGTSAGLLRRLARWPLIPVPGDGQQRLQPVQVCDLVEGVLASLAVPRGRVTLDVVGPQVFTLTEWLQRLRRVQGLPAARILPVPLRLAFGLARWGRGLSPLCRADNLRMLQAGSVGLASPFESFLGRPLRSVATGGEVRP